MTEQFIYLDNASTTQLSPGVKKVLKKIIDGHQGNPSSLHSMGSDMTKLIDESRRQVGRLLNAKKEEIYFTSGATESINTVLKGYWDGYPKAPKRLLTCKTEHFAAINAAKYLQEKGVEILYLSVDKNGAISDKELEEGLKKEPGLVSLMHVNNETGAVTNLNKVSQLISRIYPRAKFHVDAAQSLGKLHLDLSKIKIDYLSASGHKIHGPKGVGLLYIRKNTLLSPLLHGGEQENKLRSGTENILGIGGFGEAVKEIDSQSILSDYGYVKELKANLLRILDKSEIRYYVNSPEDGSPYILNLSFPGIKPEVILRLLDSKGVYISTVSACSSKAGGKSRVLEAMGLDDSRSNHSIRLGFSRYNTPYEIERAGDLLVEALRSLIGQ